MTSWNPANLLLLVDKFYISTILVRTFNVIFNLIDYPLDLIFGFTLNGGTRRDRQRAREDYDHSAQIVNILFKGTHSIVYSHQLDNFLYRHSKYVHPRYVLENDNITLHGVTSTHAFFCVTHDKTKDVLDTSVAPFMFALQFVFAEQLVIMPLKSFHRLAAELGDPSDRRVTLLDMTGRCGSTLICQMMALVPQVRTLSEPYPCIHAHGHYRKGNITLQQLKEIVRSCMRIQCKPENGKEIQHIFIKMSNLGIQLQPMLHEMFPNWKFVFISRNIKDSLHSWQKFAKSLPTHFMGTRVWVDFYFELICCPYGQEDWEERRIKYMADTKPNEIFKAFAFCHAGGIACYLANKKNYCLSIIYDDFMSDPKVQTKRLFKAIGVSLDHVDRALEGMKQDSQREMFGGRGNEGVRVEDKAWKEIDEIWRGWGCGQLRTEMSLEELREVVY